MARYKYHDEWQVSYRYDCHFWVQCRSLGDALWIAALNGDGSFISAKAECEHEGIKTTAHVGILLKDARGKDFDEIYELFDLEVDQYIACRVNVGRWGHSDDRRIPEA